MNKITGIIPPMTTPFRRDEEVDEEAFKAEVRYLINVGVHGIAVGGSTGEGHTLSTDELRKLSAIAVEEAKGNIPIITGIIVNSTRQAVEKAKAVSDLGIAALQVTPVHYLFKPDDDSMLRHFDTIAESSDLPVLIYNVIPWSYCSTALLIKIIRQVDGVIGVKQSASDMKALANLLLMCPDEGIVMSAVDALLYPSFVLGSHGAIAAILTAVPEWCIELWDAVKKGNHVLALQLHKRLLRLWNAISGDNLPACVKYASSLQGREAGLPRSPMPCPSEKQKKAIRQSFIGINYAPALT